MKIAIVHEEATGGCPDTEDVIDEVCLITDALGKLNYGHRVFTISDCRCVRNGRETFDLTMVLSSLLDGFRAYCPDVIFNMVEGNKNTPRLLPAIAGFLELSGLPVTGSRYESLLTTTDKTLARLIMAASGIPTPAGLVYAGGGCDELTVDLPCIVKPSLEDGSIGIEDECVVHDAAELRRLLPVKYQRHNRQPLLIERYIAGRELNVSVIGREGGAAQVLPVAEILFSDWPADKPRIVSYKAKWEEGSFEYENTPRSFDVVGVPVERVKALALRCWDVFALRGYARVDMRMNDAGGLFVIEVNANPCIAPWSGFIAAAREGGYSEVDVIRAIIAAAG
ncbi:D-alanine--D-alanine ligase [Candidatus Magnetobacterium bavaricum]|uniref:D-alanine--D-alanine ligase n=1 Tax=Candidatus Magnetobacterium bavaricum TaxID=29290 RepID=A0A0F3GSQ4_9BACT|nr:D-alanine--D-alanine ligase [Candidatus Magnetobacterium bavaricum]